MSRIALLVAGGIGYVLGSRAGRGPYDKLSARSEEMWQDPRVQNKLDRARSVAGRKARQAVDTTSEKLTRDGEEDTSGTPHEPYPAGRLP